MRRAVIAALVLVLLPLGALAQDSNQPSAAAPSGGTAGGDPPGVTRDRFGIAHVHADSAHDQYFLQGWVHASDRLFQMDTSRRQASGTLAELLGPAALPSDVQLRTIGLRRAAERSLAVVSPEARAALEAYAEGVNAWVDGHPLPPEYAALHLTRFQPWTAVDSVTVGKLIAFGLSFDLDLGRTQQLAAYQAAGAAGGFDGAKLFFDDLERSQPFTSASTVPDASGPPPRRGGPGLDGVRLDARERGDLEAAARLGADYLRLAGKVPALRQAVDRSTAIEGSNEWGVSARNSATGGPLLANDPHLALDQPSTFYPIELQTGGSDVIGSGFAGIPGVIVGHNRFISWGATTNPMDVTDTYLEQVRPDPSSPSGLGTVHDGKLEPVQAIPEVFRQNNPASGGQDDVTVVPPGGGVPPATLIVPRRNNGPIIQLDAARGQALSVQYTGFSATREIDTFLAWDNARNLDDFRKGLENFDFGSQNWAYSDVHGNLAYFTSGEMPLREDLQAGSVHGLPPFFVRDGTGGNEWLPVSHPLPGQAVPYEILPPDEMPQVVNPRAGFFVNANDDPAGLTLDNDPLNQLRPGGGIYYLNPGYDGFRAGRITELLRARLAHGPKLTMADMQRIQADTGLIDAEFFAPRVVAALRRARGSADAKLAALARDPAVVEAVGRLARWDFSTPTGIPEGYDASDVDGRRLPPTRGEIADSVAATVYAVWRGQIIHDVIDARVDAIGIPRPDDDRALGGIRHLLETFGSSGGVGASGIDFFQVPGVTSAADRRDLLLLGAVREALDKLAGPAFDAAFHGSTRQDDYRWGRLHLLTLDHPLGGPFSVPPGFGRFPQPLADRTGIPTDGGMSTVDAASHDARAATAEGFRFGSGPANRYVSSATRKGVDARTSLPGGTSALPTSPFYLNLLPLWLTDDSIPLRLG
jgi:penicillin amidase